RESETLSQERADVRPTKERGVVLRLNRVVPELANANQIRLVLRRQASQRIICGEHGGRAVHDLREPQQSRSTGVQVVDRVVRLGRFAGLAAWHPART